jgi:hypothetical protein
MPRSNRLRRTFAASASGGLVAALAWLPAGPAAANVINEFFATADGNSTYTGLGVFDCNLTAGTDNPESTHATFSSGSRTRQVNLDQTYTSTANSSDVTTVSGHYGGTLSVSKHHGNLAGFKMSATGHALISRALGNASQCETSAFLAVEAQTEFTEAKPGWLYVSRDTRRSTETIFVAVNEADSQPVLFDTYFGGESRATARGFMTPGTYAVPEWRVALIVGQGGALKSAGGSVQRASLANHMTGRFYVAGSALGGTHGAAGRFVRFPASVSCRHHSAKLTWTGNAGQVASGAFFVNGHRKKSVSNPTSGHSVILRHLDKTADNKITAKLSLKGGGRSSASRVYVPCKG